MRIHAKASLAVAIAAIGLSTSAWAASAAQAAAPEFTGVALGRTDQASAMLVARINPEGAAITACEFEYGTTAAYDQSAPCLADTLTEAPFVGTGGTTILPAAALLDGLEEATTYHYRLVVTNGDGELEGDDLSFETQGQPADCPACVGADGRRHLELVSAGDKEQNRIGYAKLSADGNRVLYSVVGGTPQSTFGSIAFTMAERGPSGWRSHNVLPPNTGYAPGSEYSFPHLTSPDLSVWTAPFFSSFFTIPPSPVTLLRMQDDGTQRELHTFPDVHENQISTTPAAASSEDLSHIFYDTRAAIDPAHQPGTYNVYDFGPGAPQLVSRLPNGSVPVCGADGFSSGILYSDVTQHWSSTDGSHVFFQSTPGSSCSAPQQLYRHNLQSETTDLVSGPVLAGPDKGIAEPGLLQAAPDSSWVIYKSASRLDPADANEDLDVYRWDAATETNTCLTCVVPDAKVIADGESAVASQDGSHVYFRSKAQLTPDAPAAGGIYVWRDSGGPGGSVSYAAPDSALTPSTSNGTDLTPDGNVLMFRGAAGTTADKPGGIAYFRYDDRDRSVICISCSRGPAPAEQVNANLAPMRQLPDKGHVLSADGQTVVFKTENPLLPADVNGAEDLYEWHDGKLGLISDGRALESHPVIGGVSGQDRDLLFTEAGQTALGAPETSSQLYDARLGGGFPTPTPPPTPCAGEACKGASGAPPSTPSAATPGFVGPSDPAPARQATKGCGKGRHRVSNGTKKSRCVKQSKKRKSKANSKRRAGR